MSWFALIFKAYLTFMHEALMIRHRYTLGKDRLPAKGEKYFIVCNHQNCANDPLNIMFALPLGTRIGAMARANVFSVSRPITAFLRWIGLVPAFRMGWEGAAGLEHNFQSFDMVAESVNMHRPFIIFPEAGHTQGHYLGRFTTGAVRAAFHVAKSNGWREDIKIVPAAHHYEDYFKIRTDFLLQFSEPISLQPYYERFQQHPNSVMREITHILHDRIQQMMLDEGEDDYAEKDFLRCSALNPASHHPSPTTHHLPPLPERLQHDKAFISSLCSNPRYADIISMARKLKGMEDDAGTDDITIHRNRGTLAIFLRELLLMVLSPVWIATLFPHAICYTLPLRLLHEDKMFTNSYRYILNVLGLYPLFAVLSLVIGGAVLGWWWQTVLWLLLWIPAARFCWWYYQSFVSVRHAVLWAQLPSVTKAEILTLRKQIKDIIKDNEIQVRK